MMRLSTKKILLFTAALVVILSVGVLAAEKAFVSDILINPSRYINKSVKLEGRVESSNPAGPTMPGSYVLVDDSYERIIIYTFDPPAPGDVIVVEGLVQVDPNTQVPYVREMDTGGAGNNFVIYAIIAGVIVLLLIIVLVIILTRPQKAPAAKPVTAAGPTPSTVGTSATRPATAKTRPRTEKISETEAASIAGKGRAKTEKVPSKPAQLEILSGTKKGEQILLVAENTIGRDKGNILFPDDRGVSGEHARITYDRGDYYLANVSLTNPVKVNGKAIEEEHLLAEGDEILLGTVKTKFSLMG
jgi:hypothetical protein